MRSALIFGVTGQDGSYLAELLLDKGYRVWGVVRRSASPNTARIDHLKIDLIHGDLSDPLSVVEAVARSEPDEVYNLAAQSHVAVAFELPGYTSDVSAFGAVRILECLRRLRPTAKFYQAGSSEMFGDVVETPQRETTPFRPVSPYACAKVYAHHATAMYRKTGLFTANGILYNHESPRRGENFVTRKVTRAAARIRLGLQDKLYLGNLGARRDWGFAGDYVEGMWRMLQLDAPDDFVLATGEQRSVREFVEETFDLLDLDWQEYVVHDPALRRPAEVDSLQGDADKARRLLDWEPRVTFRELVKMMVEHDLQREKALSPVR